MKAVPTLLLLATATSLAATAPSLPEPPPSSELGRAFVTIPYAELRSLWEAGRQGKDAAKAVPAPSPVGFVVQRAEYHLQLGDETSALEARYDVELLEAKWQTIPLLGGEARLDLAEAGERSVVWEEGYSLLTNQPGKAPVTLHLAAAGLRSLLGTGSLKLTLGTATVKVLSVSGLAAGQEARIDGRRADELKEGVSIFHLPGGAGEVSLTVTARKEEAAPKPPAPSAWQIHSQIVARYGEGRLLFQDHLTAHAEEGSGLEMYLSLPPNLTGLAITGEDLVEASSVRAEDGHRRIARVRWKTADVLDRELVLTYAVPQSSLAEQWTLAAPATPGQADPRDLFAIVVEEGLELKGEGLQNAVASRRLPNWMREQIGGGAFVTAETAAPLTVQPHWLPTVATAEAIVSAAKCDLRMVGDGSMQSSVSYTVRHAAPLAWQVELPKSVELLSCLLNGSPARPVLRADGVLELSLPTPTAGKGLTEIALVYAAKLPALDPVSGQLALLMPRTPLFIEHLDWQVAIPDVFEITAMEGNVSAAADHTLTAGAIALRKDLCRGERPEVDLFYQRRTLEK